ncbi:hypothetical protein FVQ98_06545 [Ottowia sp. GY511]|uniref:Uncharacterized protein n=1 Tax=Ottowia flava TaxID=2675430 RepID=A0ABW4KR12_9BURK|nr:hypothetical protein [Ottowia sp. GY511]TXK30957.1 hypothetical protein FVQ98_06545 [Ottowia sp. GY511]
MSADGDALMLRFQELTAKIQSGPKADLAVNLSVPLSVDALAREVLRHAPPRPLEIERAIEQVEDAVMPARAQLPEAFTLQIDDALLRAMAEDGAELPDAESVWLNIDAVEHLFNRLVARAEGRPATQDALPVDPGSAALDRAARDAAPLGLGRRRTSALNVRHDRPDFRAHPLRSAPSPAELRFWLAGMRWAAWTVATSSRWLRSATHDDGRSRPRSEQRCGRMPRWLKSTAMRYRLGVRALLRSQ